jgi:pimeloyl-ACP methyl ester carboxylesterase
MIAVPRGRMRRATSRMMRPPNALNYVEKGNPRGPVLLFLHGITGSRRYFEKKVRPLERDYRLVIPDLLGFGLSPKPYVEYTLELFRDSVRAFLEERGLAEEPVTIVGHSLGGLIALNYAARYPEHVRRMILVSLPRYSDPVSAHALFWKGSPHYRRLLNEHSLAETLAQMKRSGLEITLRYILKFPWRVLIDSHKFTYKSLTSTLEHCLLNYQVDGILPSVPPVPTLLIHGEQDSVAPIDHVRPLPSRYPFMRLHAMRGTGHHLFLTHTKSCLDLMRDFLAEVPGERQIPQEARNGVLSSRS